MARRKSPILQIGAVFGIGLLVCVGLGALWFVSLSSTVMTKRSPDGRHTATLTRIQGIDVNFRVKVDGKLVYDSADFAPESADFREQINWDADSRVVVLEVADRSDSELRAVEFTPFEKLGFEGAGIAASQGE
jgi:hypothetical protein